MFYRFQHPQSDLWFGFQMFMQHKSSSLNIPEEKELIVECEDVRSYPSTKHPNPVPQVKDHELALKKLAQAVFQHHSNDVDDFTMPYPQQHPEHDLHQSNVINSSNIISSHHQNCNYQIVLSFWLHASFPECSRENPRKQRMV